MTPPTAEPGRSPDLFLIGAPKCGTTSLAEHLGAHPQVFAPEIKEHHLFADDLGIRGRPTAAELAARYAARTDERWALDASISHLRSESAPRHIAAERPGARAIVVVRDPVEACEALYAQLLVTDGEDAPTLAEALRREPARAEGRDLPPDTRHPWLHRYCDVYTYVPQLQRWFTALGRDRVHVIVFDDLRDDPTTVHRDLLEFLDLDEGGPTTIGTANPRRRLRSRTLKRVLADPPAPVVALGRLVPARYRLAAWRRVRAAGNRVNRTTADAPPPPDPEVRAELAAHFAPDVAELGALLGRDLSGWLGGVGADHG